MSDVFTGRIDKLEIGTTPGTNTDIVNCILLNWELNHDVRPRLYANQKYPDEWQQPHSWGIGSFSVLSNNHTAIYATAVDGSGNFAMNEGADSATIDFMQVTYRDAQNNVQTTRFYHAIIYRYTKELLNYDDSVWIYHFLYGYAEDA